MVNEKEQPNRDLLCDMGYEDSIVFESPSYDAAIIGVSTDGQIIYDWDKMIDCLMADENMTVDEAADFISYNASYSQGSEYPIIMYRLED